MIVTALIIVALFFSIYGWLASVEFGISLMRLFPNSFGAERAQSLFSPMMEVTNVFLVFGFTGFSVLFNNALVSVSHAVLSTVSVALVVLLARACLILYAFNHKKQLGPSTANILFAICSAAVPLSFGAVGIYLLTGSLFWQTLVGGIFMAALALSLLVMGVGFIYMRQASNATRQLRFLFRLTNVLFYVTVAVVLQLLVNRRASHLVSLPYDLFGTIFLFIPIWQAALWRQHREHRTWIYLSLVALATPVLLALANRPYLIYPKITLTNAYGAAAYGTAAIIGLALSFPLLILGFISLAWLLLTPPKH